MAGRRAGAPTAAHTKLQIVSERQLLALMRPLVPTAPFPPLPPGHSCRLECLTQEDARMCVCAFPHVPLQSRNPATVASLFYF